MQGAATETDSNRVLAAGSAAGMKLEMVRQPDGWLVITADGRPVSNFRWPADELEHCVALYMAMLRNRPHG